MLKGWLKRLRLLLVSKPTHETDDAGAEEQPRENRPGYLAATVIQDIRYSLRGFRRHSVFTFTIVATLMLGIGATAAVFSVVDRILFRPLPYANADVWCR